ncbi:MAG TPA: multicopper oxidase domain-containing protein, partial [Chloroflexota bacterium]|nr:multicopper oxidase domain-containing protein [Chloroflexota bacterium]
TLALPAVLVAVWAGLSLEGRLGRGAPPRVRMIAVAAMAALGASAALAAGMPVHGLLFGAQEEPDLSLLGHVLRDGLDALAAALPIAAAVALRLRDQPLAVRGPALVEGLRILASERGLLRYSAVAAVVVLVGFSGAELWRAQAQFPESSLLADRIPPCFNGSPVKPPFLQEMPIPPPAQPALSPDATADVYQVVEQRGEAEIIPGIKTPIWGYGGITPGPTFLARKGRPVEVTFTNNLPPDEDPGGIIWQSPPSQEHEFAPSSTVVHLHGINTDHFSDGYASDGDGHKHRKLPGDSFAHLYPNNDYQRAATLWYHDHSIHITSPHLYRGLDGFYILQDVQEDALRLPGSPLADGPGRGYGVFDVPLLLKDVMIDPATGKLIYNNCSHMGAFGDVMTMNGKQQPKLSVANRKYRFRLLDGSDSRQYLLALRTVTNLPRPADDTAADEPFTMIGTDQGLFRAPLPITKFHTAPAQRSEFVVDFSRYPLGTRLVLVNLLADPQDSKLFEIMAFDVTRAEPDPSVVPPVLRPDANPATPQPDEHPADQQPPTAVHFLQFQVFDPLHDNVKPLLNTSEDWILDNPAGGLGHPFHIHLGRFKIISIEGRAPLPGELEGWHDVVWLGPGQRIRLRHQFWNFTDRFVFHCQNGSHEDFDMMGQVNVRPGPPRLGTAPGAALWP